MNNSRNHFGIKKEIKTNKNVFSRSLKSFIKIAFAFLIAILILNILVVMYDYTGGRIENKNHFTDYSFRPGIRMINAEEGFSIIVNDQNGFNNVSIPSSIDILFMGSSHLQGRQVSQKENMAFLLDQSLTDLSVYNVGMSAHELYTCVSNLDYALQCFNQLKFIIIETDSLPNDKEKIIQVINGEYPELRYADSLKSRMQTYFPVLFKAYSAISMWFEKSETSIEDKNNSVSQEELVKYQRKLLNYISSIVNDYDKVLGKTIKKLGVVVNTIITFCTVTLLWVVFRAESLSKAIEIWIIMFTPHPGIIHPYLWSFIALACLVTCTIIAWNNSKKSGNVDKNGRIIVSGFYPTLIFQGFGLWLCLSCFVE